jgi:hypothetical protein
MFGMFQKKGIGFKQIQRKKRIDRAMQLTILGIITSGFCVLVKSLVASIARFTGRNQRTVVVAISTLTVIAATSKKLFSTESTQET